MTVSGAIVAENEMRNELTNPYPLVDDVGSRFLTLLKQCCPGWGRPPLWPVVGGQR